jgi:uncharacterized membrane protein
MVFISRLRVGPAVSNSAMALVAFAGLAGSAVAGGPPTSTYSFTPLGFLPGGLLSQASAVSPDGQIVVGSGASAVGAEAFAWQAGTGLVPLPGVPLGDESSAFAVTSTGIVAGSQGDPGAERATRWAGAVNIFATRTSEANDLTNDGGVLVGRIDGLTPNTSNAFYYINAIGIVNLPLGVLNTAGSAASISANGDFIAGWRALNNSSARQAALWTRENAGGPSFTVTTLPVSLLATGSQATCVSGDGSLIVGTEVQTVGTRGVRWTRGSGGVSAAQALTTLGGFGSSALGVSQDGTVIVGTADRVAGGSAATFWRHGQAIELQSLLGGLVPNGWRLDVATDVSADGTVLVGFGRDPLNRIQAFRASVVRPCGSSDIAGPGQVGRPDGEVTADDIILFISRFTARDARGDIAGPGPTPGPDGEFTADDVILFIANFTSAC